MASGRFNSKEHETKNYSLFLWHNFNEFMEKDRCTKFCGVLISSHEVINLQSSEFVVRDFINVNVQNISLLVFFAYFFNFTEKKPFAQFLVVLTISHELMKLRSIGRFNCAST